MAEVSLWDALELLSSPNLRDRNNGLADLKHIFTVNRSSSSLNAVKDKAFHNLYETLFRLISSEKATWVKAKSTSTAATRLSSAASVLRLAVQPGVRKIRAKTVDALLDHITQTLPITGGGFCEPLSVDYLKCLTTILEYQPHVEHLSKKRWNELVDFCIKSLDTTGNVSQTASRVRSNDHSAGRSSGKSTNRTSRSSTQELVTRGPPSKDSKSQAVELIFCLRQLVKAPNAPVLDKAEGILSNAIGFLQSAQSVGRAHREAFAAINAVLSRTSLGSTQITNDAISDLIPLIKSLWAPKNEVLNDEMLISLIHARSHICALLLGPDSTELHAEVDSMADVLFTEYSQRAEKSQLQISNLGLCDPDKPLCSRFPLHSLDSYVRTGDFRAESHWVVVYLIAHFSVFLDRAVLHVQDEYRNGDDAPHKKRRTTRKVSDYLHHTLHPHPSVRIGALHVLSLMIHESLLSEAVMQDILERLTLLISDENGALASWAMLTLSSCVRQATAAAPSLRSMWVNAWQLAARNMVVASHCRAACHLMNLVLETKLILYPSIAETVESIISSVELKGPATMGDSVSFWWVTVVRLRLIENPAAFGNTANRVLHWLFVKWTPSKFDDRYYVLQSSQTSHVPDITRVISVCMDQPLSTFVPIGSSVAGPVAQAWLHASKYRHLTEYLLLLEPSIDQPVGGQREKHVPSSDLNPTRERSLSRDSLILDHCVTQIEKAKELLQDWVSDKSQSVTADVIRIVVSSCIISNVIGKQSDSRHSSRIERLERATDNLMRTVTGFISRSECEQSKVDAVLEVVSTSLPDVPSISTLDEDLFGTIPAFPFVMHLSRALEDRRRLRDPVGAEDSLESMDLDDEFSQTSFGALPVESADMPRQDIAARSDVQTLRATVSAYSYLLTAAFESLTAEGVVATLPSTYVTYLTSLSVNESQAVRSMIAATMSPPFHMSTEDAEKYFEYLGMKLTTLHEARTCEVSLGLCLDVLSAFAPTWSDQRLETLSSMGFDLLSWLLETVWKKGLASINVQAGIVDVLHSLLQACPDFSLGPSSPSVRTMLFTMLRDGDIPIKYHITRHISDMFGLFILAKHETIFDDVHNSLPSNLAWREGIALRLLIYARLASTWSTLLRRCVYHIFEAAGLIEDAVPHAERCVVSIHQALRLEAPKDILKLFAPQLIYTWLGEESVASIPWRIFQYKNLAALLRDVEDEAFGLIMMRGRESDVATFVEETSCSAEQALQRTFGKCASYCISWDTCITSSQGKTSQSSEARVKSMLAKDQHTRQMQKHFPRIFSLFFATLEQEDQVERAFSKRPYCQQAAAQLKRMKEISCSTSTLPADQQPSFNAKYLVDEIERLCRRTGQDPTMLWSAGLYVHVIRTLLDRIDPALGSLQACSVIRKIRIVIASAGTVAHEGYPLEMVLRALRPFLTDSQCADDSLGIVQYLFERGKSYLQGILPFVASISVAMLISLREFLGSTQDSTTQESQHLATLDKARAFHAWFTDYLQSFEPSNPQPGSRANTDLLDAFKSVVTAASDVRADGSSIEGTAESQLLWELLKDWKSDRKLLRGPSQDLAFRLLCGKFHASALARQDILGSEDRAVEYASIIWQSSQRSEMGDGYLIWAAKVMGRAFGSQGTFRHDNRTLAPLLQNVETKKYTSTSASKSSILQLLSKLLLSDVRTEVGLAEETLRLIISRFHSEEEVAEAGQSVPEHVITALSLDSPDFVLRYSVPQVEGVERVAVPGNKTPVTTWIRDLTISLSQAAADDPIVGALPRILTGVDSTAEQLLPYIVHVVLRRELDTGKKARQALSEAYRQWFREEEDGCIPYLNVIITTILYLRTQALPRESTILDRNLWLDLNYLDASKAALRCGRSAAALLFVESHNTQPVKCTRRSSVLPEQKLPVDLLQAIYEGIDEPDAFYGVEQESNLQSVLNRLDYESNGLKSLSFRSARLDSHMRRHDKAASTEDDGLIKSLMNLNLNSLTHSLITAQHDGQSGADTVESMLQTAIKLEQWDVRAPETKVSEGGTMFRSLQGIATAHSQFIARKHVENGLLETIKSMIDSQSTHTRCMQAPLRTLASLTEIDSIITCNGPTELDETWHAMRKRRHWMDGGRFEDVRPLLRYREALLSVLSKKERARDFLRVSAKDAQITEVQALLASSSIYRKHSALQDSLTVATYLADVVPECHEVGLKVDAAVNDEVACVLWDQGEVTASIRMLQGLVGRRTLEDQDLPVGKAGLLAKLGRRKADARMEKPEDIAKNYLDPAIKELTVHTGQEAGEVFHEFAIFCDGQLQDPEALDELTRSKKARDHREAELKVYEKAFKSARSKSDKEKHHHLYRKCKSWYEIENREFERLAAARENFVYLSLQNYLRCLQASDDHDTDVLRFFALWLDYSDTVHAVNTAKKHIDSVPSHKFAVLMNQLSSRLQADGSDFHNILTQLVMRICVDHPYHGMHHIYAGATQEPTKEDAPRLRHSAAKQISQFLKNDRRSGRTWTAIHDSNTYYHELAASKDDKFKSGREYTLDKFDVSRKMAQKVPRLKVPPATISIDLRPSGDYKDVPVVVGFRSRISIANGLSAPKILTAIASNGKHFKQLFKGGNDDLRQDAIMEQVFEQVSKLLKNHAATQQRDLHIRTYKVLPLSASSGIMEFVQNTLPLASYVMPAHEKYYPKDWSSSACRAKIAADQQNSLETRVKTYQDVTEHFHPVLRFFFLERFGDPDEWFARRLAYTRSTAAISILGHVLGLGDRHCHNILLDERSGEAVHIDLGVAFEAGRVLPVPEVVPFRLTRDLVDGMGYTKTEGVFRRCCEFTLEALRVERESIMTLLNVLRYDPLYSWTVSPVRAKRIQEGQQGGTAKGGGGGDVHADDGIMLQQSAKRKGDEADEASRALGIVERKLAKTLSTSATVNELIQQATDERNLAVLYQGWAAYA